MTHRFKLRSPLILFLSLLLWCVTLGWGVSLALQSPPTTPTQIAAVDPPTNRHQLGAELYQKTCGSCHIAIPPAVLPSETWLVLIQDRDHYGTTINPPVRLERSLIWNYLKTYSRLKLPDEQTPYRITSSRLFRALHPDVTFSSPVTLNSCQTCHLGTRDYNYRNLIPEWQNTP